MRNSTRGMAGISAIILFIAFVLVSAVAAGLYIEYSGQLSSQAQNTGEEAQEQVSNQVIILDVVGVVNGSTDSVDVLHLNARRASGAADIDLKQASLHYIHENGTAVIEYNATGARSAEYFGVSSYKDTDGSLSAGILNAQDDRANLTIRFDDTVAANDALDPGEDITLQFTTAAGGTTTTTSTVPTSLDSKVDDETIILR